MQSFIINIPEEKVDFFLELAEMLDFEVLEIEEDAFEVQQDETQENTDQGQGADQPNADKNKFGRHGRTPPAIDDPFLDWDAERQNAKKNKY